MFFFSVWIAHPSRTEVIYGGKSVDHEPYMDLDGKGDSLHEIIRRVFYCVFDIVSMVVTTEHTKG